ncbi:MAG: hypothetical protein R3F60_18820 [bacterium]
MKVIGCVALVVGLLGVAEAAPFELEVGLRLESLAFDEGVEFTCSCDPAEDPGCDTDPDFCRDARLEEPFDGYMLGALIGGQTRSRFFGAGMRVGASVGGFTPTEEKPGVDEEGIVLTQIIAELRVEVHGGVGPAEAFLQVSPRVGGLFYIDDQQDSPGTFIAGVIVSAGLRFGGDGGRVGAEGGAVVHSTFGGWMVQGTYAMQMEGPPHDEQPGSEAPGEDAPAGDEGALDLPPGESVTPP